ncbi:unnamed protein product [Chironomus riparius]|uniref:Uncharacterized protein n=1 Tax=Chironomus riparius TaxID=315576 RepID=A0A9N9RWC3_9DIPT|nr:unnamed protein product [Chironomus riparius]
MVSTVSLYKNLTDACSSVVHYMNNFIKLPAQFYYSLYRNHFWQSSIEH